MPTEETTESDREAILWPDVPRLAFGPGGPGERDADLTWLRGRPRDMYGYVEGYRRAASAIYQSAVETHASPEYMLFPLAFAWRHYVEIALKDIIAASRELAGEEWGFPRGHNLLDLWRVARSLLGRIGDPTAPELANVENNLREFDRIDQRGDGFRYPLDREGTLPTLQNAPDNVNLRLLHEAMDAVATFFSCARAELSHRLDCVANDLSEA